jgi:RNA polymerase sigma-70 factor, ECF subfamily
LPIDARLVDRLYRRSDAARWRVTPERFAEALEHAAQRGADPSALHLDDLALACGCAAGDEAAWEHFVREQRPVLYRAADALDSTGGARELADSIYGELFERSLFRYFHGRSSLATWLRAVLAQRHVDRIRALRRVGPLPDDEAAESVGPAAAGPCAPSVAADRRRCAELVQLALTRSLAELPARDRLRLACYYAQQLTLAETGKLLGEHEATCSRQLAKTRKALRVGIESRLRSEDGLSDAAIAECVASVTDDPGELDLARLLCKELPPARSTVRGTT